jgi:hypothetical protein
MHENDEDVVHPGIVSKSQKALEFMPILYFATDRLDIRLLRVEDGKRSEPRNRLAAFSDMNVVTAHGAPAFVIEFNTPLNSREIVRSFSSYIGDHMNFTSSLSLDLGALADFSRGYLPAQSSPPGAFLPGRTFAAQPDLIVWNSLSPRAGFAWQVPHSHGLILRATYFRLYAPLAGRYLDFGNPNSLGGSVYQWMAPDSSGSF